MYTDTGPLDTYTVPVCTCTMDHGLLELRRQPNLHPTDLAYTTQIIRTLHELVESSTPYICTGQGQPTASPTHQEAIHMKHRLWVQDTFLQCLESPLQFLHDYGKGEGGRGEWRETGCTCGRSQTPLFSSAAVHTVSISTSNFNPIATETATLFLSRPNYHRQGIATPLHYLPHAHMLA